MEQEKIPGLHVIIQARMGSTRLPNKVLKEVMEKPLLGYLIERLQESKLVEKIIVATTIDSLDDEIVEFCMQENITVERGSEKDVLDRYYQTALSNDSEIIIRITGDCPLMDPKIMDKVISAYRKENGSIEYVTNVLKRTYPRGMDVEVFSFDALETAWKKARNLEEREHPTLSFIRHPELFRSKNVENEKDESEYRLTVDTKEDFTLIAKILETLYPKNPKFDLSAIIHLLEKKPDLVKINAHIEQKAF